MSKIADNLGKFFESLCRLQKNSDNSLFIVQDIPAQHSGPYNKHTSGEVLGTVQVLHFQNAKTKIFRLFQFVVYFHFGIIHYFIYGRYNNTNHR